MSSGSTTSASPARESLDPLRPGLGAPGLCVFGNINRDIRVQRVPGAARLLEDGETTVAGVVETMGGGGANSACAAAALGARVRLVGRIGDDELGSRLESGLARQGVEPWLRRDAHVITGTTVALDWDGGARHFLSCLPNNAALEFGDLDPAVLDGCGHLLRADVWFSESMLADGNLRLLAMAQRKGLITSLDINFDPCWNGGDSTLIARRKAQLRAALPYVDLAHGNVVELCRFTDSPSLAVALERLTAWGVKAIVVHLGLEGAGFYAAGTWTVEPPDLAVDPLCSTGTGDVLSVTMMLLHARADLGIHERLHLANRVVREYMEGRRTLIPRL